MISLQGRKFFWIRGIFLCVCKTNKKNVFPEEEEKK